MKLDHPRAHRSACLKITLTLLVIWFVVSCCGGILFRDWLDANMPSIGSAPFGFWIAQQGSIITFVLILIVYAVLMNRLDNKHGYTEEN
ncbi:MAG: putative solute:sodium symporter small subunit [Candidatus Pelagisphaera sp.]|jgi:putative solute:sodium symporter small subunit